MTNESHETENIIVRNDNAEVTLVKLHREQVFDTLLKLFSKTYVQHSLHIRIVLPNCTIEAGEDYRGVGKMHSVNFRMIC